MESPHTLVHGSSPREPAPAEPTRRRFSRALPRGGPPEGEASAELLLGRYRLLERLGAGGFGVVWRARDELLHREVAVKRIWLGLDGDSERATREAHATARLSHPAIVALYEASALDGAFYLISELVEGDTLARLIAAEDLEDEEILEIGLALVGALSHAHARGVIHRDIKPQNVLVPERASQSAGAAKLTDFGGASLVGEEALTRTGDVLGTLAYMAPEQSEGAEVGEPADLYALALVLYEALTGANPVRGSSPAATARRIGTRLESISRSRRDLPRGLASVLDRALDPDPRRRGKLEELGLALEEALEHPGRESRTLRASHPRAAQRLEDRVDATRRHPAAPTPPVSYPPRARSPEEPAGGPHEERPPARRGIAMPRPVWIAAALLAVGWQASSGRPGVALLLLVALLPLLAMPGERSPARRSARLGWSRLACVLAPALGVVGLAGAFPALAGQANRWRDRAALGALGYWWLILAEPLLDRRLWLGETRGTPARAAWEGSLGASATHVILPLLSVGVLCGALLWAGGAIVLPWLVRGASATLDIVLSVLWSAALLASAPWIDSGLASHALHPSPRGALLGAILGGMTAVAGRALRGPV